MAWNVDMAHTQVAFAVRHLGVSAIRGNFHLAEAEFELDETNKENAHLKAKLDVNTLDTRNANRDGHLKSPDFFDVANFPFIEYESKQVRDKGNGKFEVTGDLTVKGVKREIKLAGEYAGPVDDPASKKRKVGFLLEGDINKKDFGIDWNVPMSDGGFMLTDKISLTIDAQAVEA